MPLFLPLAPPLLLPFSALPSPSAQWGAADCGIINSLNHRISLNLSLYTGRSYHMFGVPSLSDIFLISKFLSPFLFFWGGGGGRGEGRRGRGGEEVGKGSRDGFPSSPFFFLKPPYLYFSDHRWFQLSQANQFPPLLPSNLFTSQTFLPPPPSPNNSLTSVTSSKRWPTMLNWKSVSPTVLPLFLIDYPC